MLAKLEYVSIYRHDESLPHYVILNIAYPNKFDKHTGYVWCGDSHDLRCLFFINSLTLRLICLLKRKRIINFVELI